MSEHRYRIRFRKCDDLQWISHRDLVRLWERLLRRIALPLARTQGFHPKPKLTFPSALPLGVVAEEEVLEIVLQEPRSVDALREQMNAEAPPGLVIRSVNAIDRHKGQVARSTYRLPLPAELRSATQDRLEMLMRAERYEVARTGRSPVDIRPDIEQLGIVDEHLELTLRHRTSATARPRDVLQVLELTEHVAACGPLVRTSVQLEKKPVAAGDPSSSASPAHETTGAAQSESIDASHPSSNTGARDCP